MALAASEARSLCDAQRDAIAAMDDELQRTIGFASEEL